MTQIDRNANTPERQRRAIQQIADTFDKLVIPNQDGTPTDTPSTKGTVRFDGATNKLWVWNGTAWKSTTLT